MLISKFRNLVLMEFSEGKVLTVASNTCNSIGGKDYESKIDAQSLGYLITRVCIFETLCYRALPKVIVNNLYVGTHENGDEVLAGINRAMSEFNGLNLERTLTEENLASSTEDKGIDIIKTDFGVTVIGEEVGEERFWEINKGDLLVSFGDILEINELVEAIKTEDDRFLSMKSLKVILDYSKDVICIDNKGIDKSINILEETNGIEFERYEDKKISISENTYAGTMILAVVEEEMLGKIERRIDETINVIGKVKLLK